MPAPSDSNKYFLAAAYPLNSEWVFTDASPYIRGDGATGNHVARSNTSVVISTNANKYYAQSGYFNGNGAALVSGTTIDIPGDFTFEAWVRFAGNNSAVTDQHFFAVRDASGNGVSLMREYTNSNRFAIYMGSTGISVAGTTTLADNTWYHVAATRSGSTVKLFVNGVQEYTGTPSSFTVGARKISVGGRWDAAYGLNGYLQDARLYIGKATYTSNFTPPSSIVDYNNDTSGLRQTILALPMNNVYRYGDASSQLRTWGANCGSSAVNDIVVTSAQSKFYGHSAYFDGNEDHLFLWNLNGQYIGRNDFTVEGWVYHTGSADDTIFSDSSSFSFVYGASGNLRFYMAGGSNLVDANTSYISNQWVHVAVVRSNGTLTFYQNGVARGSHAYDYDIGAFGAMYLGKFYGGSTQGWAGYMNDIRIYNGFAKYTSGFTPTSTAMTTTPSVTTDDAMKLIGQITITSTPSSVVEFTGIPQNFKNLYLVYSPKTNGNINVSTLAVRINGITSNTYASRLVYGEGSGQGGINIGVTSYGHFGYSPASGTGFDQVSTFGGSEAWFVNYTSSSPKSYFFNSHHVSNASSPTTYQSGVQAWGSGGNAGTTPIYSIWIAELNSNSFLPDSTFYLYGLKG